MTAFTRINRYFRRYRHTLNRHRTERLIGSLPAEIRKDIGWPNQYRMMQSEDFDYQGIARS